MVVGARRTSEEEGGGSWKAVAWGQLERHITAAISNTALETRMGRTCLLICCRVSCIIDDMLVMVDGQELIQKPKGWGSKRRQEEALWRAQAALGPSPRRTSSKVD